MRITLETLGNIAGDRQCGPSNLVTKTPILQIGSRSIYLGCQPHRLLPNIQILEPHAFAFCPASCALFLIQLPFRIMRTCSPILNLALEYHEAEWPHWPGFPKPCSADRPHNDSWKNQAPSSVAAIVQRDQGLPLAV